MDITVPSDIRLSDAELALLSTWGRAAKVTEWTLARRSDREFDLTVEGKTDQYPSVPGVSFSAWLPLACISDLTSWSSPDVYGMCDYPFMEGDWSGIRDSEPGTVWAIFEQHVLGA